MSDLIERLRRFSTRAARYGDVFMSTKPSVCSEAVDALEAAEQRIAELTVENKELDDLNYMQAGRIAELEAELKATQENEQRLVDANKPLLARAYKAEADNEWLRAVYEAAKEWRENNEWTMWYDELLIEALAQKSDDDSNEEIKPTSDHSSDPYALMLIEALAKRDDEIERLRAALQLHGTHTTECAKWDKMDSGQLFMRHDWPCSCGLEEALAQESDNDS